MNPVILEDVLFDIDRQMKLLCVPEYKLLLDGIKFTIPKFNEMAQHIKPWNDRAFTCTDASMYSSFLWMLSREIMNIQLNEPNKLNVNGLYYRFIYMLNRMLHGIDVPPDVNMPDIFYWPHTVGIVIARKAKLSNYLCMYQGTVIGRVGDKIPEFLGPCIMYPYSTVTGDSIIQRGSVINTHEVVKNSIVEPLKNRSDLFEFHFNVNGA